MSKYFVILVSFLSFQLCAIEIDSVERAKIIREGQTELCQLLEFNSHVTSPLEMRFVVVIDGNPATTNHAIEKNIQHPGVQIMTQVTIDSINAELARTYTLYGAEMFIIYIQSLDFVLKTTLPAYPSGADLFTNHLYDEQSNLTELRATHLQISNEIIANTLSGHDRDCIVYTRAQYSGTYAPGKVGHWSLGKRIVHYGFSNTTYPKLPELLNVFNDRTQNNSNVTYSNLEPSLREVAHQFYLSAKYMELRGQILSTLTSEGMSNIFQQFTPYDDYEHLTEEERIHALAVFAGYPMHDNLAGNREEYYAVRIMETTPSAQVPDFLTHLSQTSPLQSNPAYLGFKPNEALIVGLIREIDDALVEQNGNNYSRMLRALTTIELSNQEYAGTHMPSTDQEWVDRRIYWDDWHALDAPPVGTHDYDAVINGNGTVTLNKKVVDRLDFLALNNATGAVTYAEHWDESYTPLTLNPFDLVVFTNRSSLGMLEFAGMPPNQPYLAPAIFLKYANDKAFNTNAITVTAIAFDMVAIASGPFAISNAIRAGDIALAVFEGLQFIGAEANLVANSAASQNFKEAVGIFNVIVGGWGIARVSVSGVKYTADYLSGVKSGDIHPIPMSTANEYCTRYDAITDWSYVDDATKEEMRRMRELLGEEVVNIANEVDLISDRTSWYNNLTTQYCPFNINNFHTNGIAASSVPATTFNEMLAEYSSAISLQDKTRYCNDLIASGSTVPVKHELTAGAMLIKVVPKGQKVSAYTAYFMTMEEFNSLENSALIEQKLGLPLTSHSISYDVYTISSTSDAVVFESTVAPTIENGYSTIGGAKQTLVIDRSKWSAPTFLKTLTPPSQL